MVQLSQHHDSNLPIEVGSQKHLNFPGLEPLILTKKVKSSLIKSHGLFEGQWIFYYTRWPSGDPVREWRVVSEWQVSHMCDNGTNDQF